MITILKARPRHATFSHSRYDPEHFGIKFRLGGNPKEMSFLKLGWRVRLYTKRKSKDNTTLSGLSKAETVKENCLLMEFGPSIRDSGFNVGNTKVASIRNRRGRLQHSILAFQISKVGKGQEFDYGWMFVTRIARSFGLLTNDIRDALIIEPPPHVFKKKSLIAMGVIMELKNRICVWLATRAVEEEEEAEAEAEGEAANKGVGGSAKMYQNMSQGFWQVCQARWMDQQDERWEHLDSWMGQHEIDPFLGCEADYPPYGYHGCMPPGYAYHLGPSHDGSS
nr:hypothetical protein [Tanacetum cinerariifolium]